MAPTATVSTSIEWKVAPGGCVWPPPPQPHVCPRCGHCPTCGRSNRPRDLPREREWPTLPAPSPHPEWPKSGEPIWIVPYPGNTWGAPWVS